MNSPDTLIGFDGTADGDTSLVVLHRAPDGTWQIETTEGPDALELARLAGQLFEQRTAQEYTPPAAPPRWGEWLTALADGPAFDLDDEQRRLIVETYDQLIREKKLSHPAGERGTHQCLPQA